MAFSKNKNIFSLWLLVYAGLLFFTNNFATAKPAPEPIPKPAPKPVPVPEPADPGTAPKYSVNDIVAASTGPNMKGNENNIEMPAMQSIAKSKENMLTANLQYKNYPAIEAWLDIHFRVEDVGRCVQWVSNARCTVTDNPLKYNTTSNSVIRATEIKFGTQSIIKGNGDVFAENVLFYLDKFCRKVVGLQQDNTSGVLERPAYLNLRQADPTGDRGRASIYLQSIGLPPMFYTKIF
ncbi:hypothetical protein ABW20_dc0104814 [Dactylellina cionopaga]|nr:hypothetical protein ABW20_dc0104814 [Dactylellina cionopaga]